jgi:hypothetical protein
MKIDGIVFFFYSLAPPLGSDGEWSEEISIDNGQLLRYRRRRILFLGVKKSYRKQKTIEQQLRAKESENKGHIYS